MAVITYEVALREIPARAHRFRNKHSQVVKQEDVLGSIEEGKLADFTVLDRDILEIEAKEILRTKVLYTIVGGKIRYRGI